jgi:hypothetical protein
MVVCKRLKAWRPWIPEIDAHTPQSRTLVGQCNCHGGQLQASEVRLGDADVPYFAS